MYDELKSLKDQLEAIRDVATKEDLLFLLDKLFDVLLASQPAPTEAPAPAEEPASIDTPVA